MTRISMAIFIVLLSAFQAKLKAEENFRLNFEKYILPNGLEVVLHPDKSDPIVAIAIQYHVQQGGSRQNRICPPV